MRRAMQAALLSGIVFPGLGQLWLKRYLKGAILVVAVSASLAIVALKAAHTALAILERMEAGGVVDMVAVADLATRASVTPDDVKTKAALAVLALCWIAGVVDAYLVGRKEDVAGRAAQAPPAKTDSGRKEEVRS